MIAIEVDFTKLQHFIYDNHSKKRIALYELEHIILNFIHKNKKMEDICRDKHESESDDTSTAVQDSVDDIIDILIDCGFLKRIGKLEDFSIKSETK